MLHFPQKESHISEAVNTLQHESVDVQMYVGQIGFFAIRNTIHVHVVSVLSRSFDMRIPISCTCKTMVEQAI